MDSLSSAGVWEPTSALDVDGATQGPGHAPEGHHEPVTLHADFAAAMTSDGVTHNAMVLA